MHRDVSLCNTYNYGDALYWDARYVEEGGASFDWYQRYSALRPFVRKFFPTSSRVLMVGCGNAGIIPFYLLPRLLPLNFLLPKPIPKSDELKRLLAAAVVMGMLMMQLLDADRK
ncbi:hypothetical protein COCNU_02G017590 [Cocos nucifera]|uniref:Uncharacterized protein n=1 Tax=Cocos nucifera TaxID=13894 RepID=A0A8K0MXL1_COCNU|nr:hypothetical protein COCNU_02G017590 [Cocos nucifera]